MIRQIARLRVIALTLMVGLGALWTVNAQAANNNLLNHLYYGAKAGFMMPDVNGLDNAVNIGVFAGAPVAHLAQGTIAVEGELTTTAIKGDVNYFGINGHWDVTTLAGYGVFHTDGPMYFKAKAGILYEDYSVTIGGFPGSGTDTNLSFGVGGGMRLSGGSSIELEYTIVESDINFLSIGYKF